VSVCSRSFVSKHMNESDHQIFQPKPDSAQESLERAVSFLGKVVTCARVRVVDPCCRSLHTEFVP